jgi:hypothetical protein
MAVTEDIPQVICFLLSAVVEPDDGAAQRLPASVHHNQSLPLCRNSQRLDLIRINVRLFEHSGNRGFKRLPVGFRVHFDNVSTGCDQLIFFRGIGNHFAT